ncbi:MAG: hypothetical protein ACOH2T_19140 [Pseudomonas sp.]
MSQKETDFSIVFTVKGELSSHGYVRAMQLHRALADRMYALLLAEMDEACTEVTLKPFVGEDHPRYEEWMQEVCWRNTVLGLSDWLEHNPDEEEEIE